MAAVGALVLAGVGPVGAVRAEAAQVVVVTGARPRDPGPVPEPGPAAPGQRPGKGDGEGAGGTAGTVPGGTAAAAVAGGGTVTAGAAEPAGAPAVPAGAATGTPADGTGPGAATGTGGGTGTGAGTGTGTGGGTGTGTGAGGGAAGGVTSVALEQSGSFIGPDQNAVPATPVIPGVAPETPGRDPDVVLEDPALKDPSLKLPPVAGRGPEEARPQGGLTPEPQGPGTPARPTATRGHDLEAAIAFALAHIGDPYVLGGVGPRRWDCSGLIQQAYRKAGVRLPRIAADQYRATTRVTRSALRRGDLVFWTNNGRISGIHHAAIYLGGGRYIEAPRPGRKVRISTFSYYNPNLYGRVR